MMAGILTGLFGNKAVAEPVVIEKGKAAVVYFSWSTDGNTRFAAQTIAKKLGAEMFEIKAEKPYPTDYRTCTREAKPECQEKTLRAILPIAGLDLAKYDAVFVGTPNWWGTMAPPVRTWVTNNKAALKGKAVCLFQTNGGGGMQHVGGDFAELLPESNVLPAAAFSGGSVKSSVKALETFVTDRVTMVDAVPAKPAEWPKSDWDKVFPPSDKVEHCKVNFPTRFGMTLVADLYKPKGATGRLAAIAVSGPFGAVKEQSSGLYAQTLAERGFLTIAFDPSYTGESTGTPRYVASPDINTEDFQAAVDYLISRDDVDAERIGILGVCGWGGLAINAAAIDTRVKATVASTMYDMTRVTANGYNDANDTQADRMAMRRSLNAQRNADYGKTPERAGGVINPLPADAPQFVKDYHAYYKTPRGYHPRSLNSTDGWNKTSALSFLNAKLLAYAGEIESAVMIVHGEKAHSRYFGETAFKMLKGDNKELVIVPGANHCDLYDQMDKIPFDKIAAFYTKYLK